MLERRIRCLLILNAEASAEFGLRDFAFRLIRVIVYRRLYHLAETVLHTKADT